MKPRDPIVGAKRRTGAWRALLLFLYSAPALACPLCHSETGQQVRAGIFDGNFGQNILYLLLPALLFAMIVAFLHARNRVVSAGTVLGLGMGGFIDGILLHQILQLHNMLSNRLSPDTLVNVEINMFWDGLFHALTWVTTAIGIALLWRAARQGAKLSTRAFVGSLLLGFGIFNLVEGLINHQIFGLHHVVQRASPEWRTAYDLAFLASGLILIALGGLVIRKKKGSSESQPKISREIPV